MTQDEMIQMLTQAGWFDASTEFLKRFANLVTNKEREACAKLCDALAYHPEFASDATKLAAMAIRARGQA